MLILTLFLVLAQFDSSRNATQSFWNYGRSALDFLPNFGIYQLATR